MTNENPSCKAHQGGGHDVIARRAVPRQRVERHRVARTQLAPAAGSRQTRAERMRHSGSRSSCRSVRTSESGRPSKISRWPGPLPSPPVARAAPQRSTATHTTPSKVSQRQQVAGSQAKRRQADHVQAAEVEQRLCAVKVPWPQRGLLQERANRNQSVARKRTQNKNHGRLTSRRASARECMTLASLSRFCSTYSLQHTTQRSPWRLALPDRRVSIKPSTRLPMSLHARGRCGCGFAGAATPRQHRQATIRHGASARGQR